MYRCNCGKEYNNETSFNEHKKNCQNGDLSCQLCNKNITACDLDDHLLQCSNLNVQCPICSKYVLRGFISDHIDNNCVDLVDNNTDAVINKDPHEPSSSTLAKPTTIESDHVHEHKRYSTIAGSLAEESSDTLNTSVERFNLNSNEERSITSACEQSISKESPNSILQKKPQNLENNLHKIYYPNEIEKLQFNILIIGSPRVGKSQLINALCGEENLAKTSASLDSCTKEVKCYTMKKNKEQTSDVDLDPFGINFYDTPGVESWIGENGITTMRKFIQDKNPVCLIYCAAPGTFADLKQVHQLLEFCKEKQIFCALVCTSMWANSNRKGVLKEFERELAFFGDRMKIQFEQQHDQSNHEVIHFGDGALCTMVNSTEYRYDPEISKVIKPVQGIDELIHCIMEKLDNEKLLGWCHAVLYRRSYWEKIKQKTAGFVSARMENAANWSNTMFRPMAKNAAYFLKKFQD